MSEAELQLVKKAMVAALHECGLVEHSPISVTERQRMAIGSVLIAGRRALAVLTAYAVNPRKVDQHQANTATVNLNAVLDELQREFGV